jgi:hypothetical protein
LARLGLDVADKRRQPADGAVHVAAAEVGYGILLLGVQLFL